MNLDTVRLLDEALVSFPILYAADLPTIAEVDDAAALLNVPFSADYIEFVLRYGGAMVGPFPVFGLRPVEVMDNELWSVVNVTNHYREMNVPGTANWAIVSEDQAGNPVGMDRGGEIWIHDHDFGGISKLAADFESYLRLWCLKL